MTQITPSRTATLRHWFAPERSGPLVGLHVMQTGSGATLEMTINSSGTAPLMALK